MSTDPRFNRGFDKLTSDYCRERIDRLDEMIADPENSRRVAYLEEQVNWWRGQQVFCWRREGLLRQ
jgi:hypothetical protein